MYIYIAYGSHQKKYFLLRFLSSHLQSHFVIVVKFEVVYKSSSVRDRKWNHYRNNSISGFFLHRAVVKVGRE